MKSLILAACLLVATVASTVSATEFCPAGQLSSNVTIALDTPGATHSIAAGCILDPDLDITIDASMPAGTTSSAPATLTISQVNFGRRDVLIFKGYPNQGEVQRLPYVINILNNQFGNDAAIFFRGALPPTSVVTISGNRLNASTPLGLRIPPPYTSVSTWAASIIIYDIMLLAGAKVFVTENSILGSDIVGNHNIFGVYVVTQAFFFGDGSRLSISKNNITTLCNPLARNGICGYGVMTNSIYVYAKGEFNVDENTFNTAGSLVSSLDYIVNPALNTAHAKITFNGNKGTLNTMYLFSEVDEKLQAFTSFKNTNLQQQSSLEIMENSFDITGDSGMFAFQGDFITGENASVTVGNNKLVTRTCTPGIYFEDHSTTDSSRLRILNNDFYRDDDTNINAPMVYFAKSIGLKGKSTFTVAYNKYGGREVPTGTKLIDLSAAAVNGFTFDGDARLYVCGNVVGGTALLTTNAVWGAIHSALQPRVLVSNCAGNPLPTNPGGAATTTIARTTTAVGGVTTAFPVPTTNSNTTDPLGNSGAGAMTKNTVLIAVVTILVCSLLQ
jgi:hypothetical protein